jgi:broad specificity phosphatase PhoE
MRLFIIRHADPDYANNTITPAGHLEARALAERFKKLGLDRIYSSPLGRAIHTMQYTADALHMSHTIEEWTAEKGHCRVTGEWGDYCAWDVPGEAIRARSPYVTHDNWHEHELFGNPQFLDVHKDICRNSDAFLARHGYVREGGRYRIVKSNREKIAVFCHGGFGLWWLAHLLELPLPLVWSGFHMPASSVTTVLFDERSETWAVPRCTAFGDTSHLYAAGLPIAKAGIKANCD